MRIIAIANQKGGTAKTTTAVTLAHGLAIKGHDVVILDLDPQGQCASCLGRDHEPGIFNLLVNEYPLADVARSTGREHLRLVPGDKRTVTAQAVFIAEGRSLADALGGVVKAIKRSGAAYCILDTSPSLGGLQEAALHLADLVIIPAAVDYLSAEAVAATLATCRAVAARGGRGGPVWVLPTFADRTKETRAILADLTATLGTGAILAPIPRATAMREASAEGKTIWEFGPDSKPAVAYADLVWRVLDAKT